MSEFNKNERKELRQLADLAHERELESALKDLEKEFKEWKKGNIDSFELNHKIHTFHNGISRDLYKKYNYSVPSIEVGWAIANDIIQKEEVDENILEKIKLIIEKYS